MTRELVFEIKNFKHSYKIYSNGEIEGFEDFQSCIVVNRIPIMIAILNREHCQHEDMLMLLKNKNCWTEDEFKIKLTNIIDKCVNNISKELSEIVFKYLYQNEDKKDACCDIQRQNKEFDAMEHLAKQWNILKSVGVVDDGYPEVRYKYESAVSSFLEACKANWRI